MFVKIQRGDPWDSGSLTLYECDKIFICNEQEEHAENAEGIKMKYIELQRLEGSGLASTREVMIDPSDTRLYIMNDRGETIDRIFG